MGEPDKKVQPLFGDVAGRMAARGTTAKPARAQTGIAQFRPLAAPSHANAFEQLWVLGYHRLCPIIPPGAPISERSSLFKRIGKGRDPRGKTPGVKRSDGTWSGFDFVAHESAAADLARWHAMGAGVGIKTGQGLALIDADASDPDAADIIRREAEARFGRLPVRIGRAPKAGYLVRVEGEFQYARVEFGQRDAKGRARDRVEILYEGRQFVAHGIHPTTGKPYQWPDGVPALHDVPVATAASLTAFLDALGAKLPGTARIVQEGDAGPPVAPELLVGDIDRVRAAIASLPNTTALFPVRESYVSMAYAVRGAFGPAHEDEARAAFLDWCARWEDPDGEENDPDEAAADWARARNPRIGAEWLFKRASQHGGAAYSEASAARWLEPHDEPLFPDDPRTAAAEPNRAAAGSIKWVDPVDWAMKPIPPREWLLANVVPFGEVSAIYGEGGIGKTLLAHQLSVCCAAGLPFLGQETRRVRVLAFFCEDSEDELQRRHADILRASGLEHSGTGNHLRVTSRRTQDNRLAVWDPRARTMNVTPLWHEIRRDALRFDAGLIALDTLSDIFGGEENDRAQVTSFVTRCLNKLAAETGATVLVLAHPSANGASSGSGHSGSTAWNGKFRARLFLKRAKGVDRDVRELEGMKANYGPAGAKLKLRWDRGAFTLLASSGLGAAASKIVPQLDDAAEQAVVAALQECTGEKLSIARNSSYFAPKVLKARAPELLRDWSEGDVREALDRLLARGAVQAAKAGRDASGHSISTLVLVEDALKARAAVSQEDNR